MHAGDYNDFFIKDAVEESVGEPVKKRTSCFPMNDWKPVWILLYGAKNQADLFQIFFP